MLQSICVFCGSSKGKDPVYAQKAEELGHLMAQEKITLVYGGGKIGLMGIVAKSALKAGGQVLGVIPKALYDRELGYEEVSHLYIVDSMHERKAKMASLAEGFIAMPGGLGTLEEFFEILTWAQLGIHNRPCGLLNVKDYYNPLLQMVEHITQEGFVHPHHLQLFVHDEDPQTLLQKLKEFQPPTMKRWLHSEES